MKNVVHRHGDLLPHLLKKLHVASAVRVLAQACKTHRPQLSDGRGQRHHAKRIDTILLHPLGHLRPAQLFTQIRHEDRLLQLPDQSGRSFLERLFMAADQIGRDVGLNRLQAHPVASGIM